MLAKELAAEGADAEDERRGIRSLRSCAHGFFAQYLNHADKRLPLDREFHVVSNPTHDRRPHQTQTPFGRKFREAKSIASTPAPGWPPPPPPPAPQKPPAKFRDNLGHSKGVFLRSGAFCLQVGMGAGTQFARALIFGHPGLRWSVERVYYRELAL
jgi:hypothetical protein